MDMFFKRLELFFSWNKGHQKTSCQRLEENADLADHENDFVGINYI